MKWSGMLCMCIAGIGCQFLTANVVSALDVPPAVPAGLADSPWPDYGGGAQNKHLANARAFAGQPEVRWSYDLSAVQNGQPHLSYRQPVLGPDGSITFTTVPLGGENVRSGQIHTLWPDGTVKWVQTQDGSPRPIQYWPAIEAQGFVAHTSWLRSITNLGSVSYRHPDDGHVVWSFGPFEPQPPIRFHIAQTGTTIVDRNGESLIVAADEYGVVSALTADGKLQWQLDLPDMFYVSPAVSLQSQLIYGGDRITAVSLEGDIVWTFDQPGALRYLSPSVADDGTIYVSHTPLDATRAVTALSPMGAVLWQRAGVGGPISIGPDGTLYAADKDRVVALDPHTAQELWSYHTGDIMESNAEGVTVDLDGNLFIGTRRGEVLSLSSSGELRWSIDLAPESTRSIGLSAPVIGANGDIYIAGGSTGMFFALSAARVPEPASIVVAAVGAMALLLGAMRRRFTPGC